MAVDALILASLVGLVATPVPDSTSTVDGDDGTRTQDDSPLRRELDAGEEPFFEFQWLEAYLKGPGFTGDWGGHRAALESRGVSVAGSVIDEWSWVPPGEGAADRWGYRYLVDVGLELDLERLCGWEGGQFFVDFQTAATGVDGGLSGSASGFPAIGVTERIVQLSEAWLQQRLGDGPWSVRLGKIDANADFAAMPVVADFVASSAAQLTTIFALPTYPSPGFGIEVFLDPGDDWHFGFGLFDGGVAAGGVASIYDSVVDGDVFLIANGVHRPPDLFGEALTGRFEVGGWWTSGRFDEFGGGDRRGTGGVWANSQIRCWAPGGVDASDDQDLAGLWWFGQYGWTPDQVFEVGTEWGTGLVLDGTFPGRDEDSVGLYVTWTESSRDPASGLDGRWETLLEGYYAWSVSPWITVQPDVQFVVDPGGTATIPDTWVFTLRLTLGF